MPLTCTYSCCLFSNDADAEHSRPAAEGGKEQLPRRPPMFSQADLARRGPHSLSQNLVSEQKMRPVPQGLTTSSGT